LGALNILEEAMGIL